MTRVAFSRGGDRDHVVALVAHGIGEWRQAA